MQINYANNINYANIAWATTNKTKLKKLFEKQKQVVRIIFNQDRFTHSKDSKDSNEFPASASVHAQDKNKLIPSNLPTSVSKNKP